MPDPCGCVGEFLCWTMEVVAILVVAVHDFSEYSTIDYYYLNGLGWLVFAKKKEKERRKNDATGKNNKPPTQRHAVQNVGAKFSIL